VATTAHADMCNAGVQGVEVDADHRAFPPPHDSWRHRYSPKAYRLARPVVKVVSLLIVNFFRQGTPLIVNPVIEDIPL
jgi:hypothetical protein